MLFFCYSFVAVCIDKLVIHSCQWFKDTVYKLFRSAEAEFHLYKATAARSESFTVCLLCIPFCPDTKSQMETKKFLECYEFVDCQKSLDRLTDEQMIAVDIEGSHGPDIQEDIKLR